MDHNKSKHVTTSVPSITIKFDASAEKIEELYASDEEQRRPSDSTSPSAGPVSNLSDADSSPLKYLPKLVKRSTSVDVTSTTILSSSPPSDTWRFFSDIKGKFAKSVNEITSRNQEDGSPQHKAKTDLKTVKDSKENSSLSDSEELSESSISKTCGIFSTTEGVEMSSDEDTPSIEKDKEKKDEKLSTSSATSGLRHRFRFMRNKAPPKEGTVKRSHLSKLYNINTEKIEQALPEDSEDVESAVDALEEANLKENIIDSKSLENIDVLKAISQKFINIEVDNESILNVREVSGKEIRRQFLKGEIAVQTVFAPTGFVDLRPEVSSDESNPSSEYLPWTLLAIFLVVYVFLHWLSSYLAGFLMGVLLSYAIIKVYLKLNPASFDMPSPSTMTKPLLLPSKIMEIPAVKEYLPLLKYEGWVNEYPDTYNPITYHISQTQSVYLRLQGNLLRMSHSKTKIPKRAMWNESEIKPTYSHHRVYNLLGAKVTLLPDGLAKVRLWSKKYPICITLNLEQMNFDETFLKVEFEDDENDKDEKEVVANTPKEKKGFFRKKDYSALSQRFSKLTEGEEFASDESRASTPSPEVSDVQNDTSMSSPGGFVFQDFPDEGESNSLTDGSLSLRSADVSKTPNKPHTTTTQPLDSKPNDSPSSEVKIYIFGRTDREKEDWFRRLTAATHGKVNQDSASGDSKDETDISAMSKMQEEYIKYMAIFNKASRKPSKQDKVEKEETLDTSENSETKTERLEHILWLNALMGRVLFDCVRDPNFSLKLKERIQRKLCSIKLPYFIEELSITELSLGKTPPFIQKTNKPSFDERGLWVDIDITYEGLIILTLQTKLNLMKLKNPQLNEIPSEIRSAIYHSDVDDSAESSSDEEGPQELLAVTQEGTSSPVVSRENPSKKFIKMVDRIAESKIFQAATEIRYIKKAMEGVSNTDLRLTVEVKRVAGTVVLNIPPPPSDRVWIGFRPVPEILISARPIVGERNITPNMVTSWIEKKLLQEFQKIMVIPNMEDLVIPVMNSRLPE